MNLVIVESPTKGRTISQFLGKDYKVESSFGHIRDLPKSKLGIDVEKNFEPQYIIPIKARKRVNQLKKEIEKAERVILATDEDREGEAIAWHLTQALGLQSTDYRLRLSKKTVDRSPSTVVQRIVFHEITKSAIEEAFKNPRGIDMDLVDAQQARRVLDRLVGYKLSPFLWKKIMSRLSAGRVQSVVLRLIVEREGEIKNFKTEEYYSIEATLQSRGVARKKTRTDADNKFIAILYKINNDVIPKLGIKTKKEADKIVDDLKKCDFKVAQIEKKEVKKNPLPPFTTSTLQQEASKRLRLSAKQTMRLAQNLYENGFITYMRTDSVSLSKESVFSAKNWIGKNLGQEYTAQAPRFFKTKLRLAQEAHEAIRPTQVGLLAEKLKTSATEKKLYDLIWRRFIASQLPQAIFDMTSVYVIAESREIKRGMTQNYTLRANGSIIRFDGFLKIWPIKFAASDYYRGEPRPTKEILGREEKELPPLEEKEELNFIEANANQHFTEPPPRYNEASLIKTLEKYGIGRPSTYAPIISVIQERNYVFKNEQRRFQPTEIGESVNKILVEHFPQIVDIKFTAEMENELDEIAQGKLPWQTVIKEFYNPFSENLEKKYKEVEKQKLNEEKTDEVCERCGQPMVIKWGRFGKFLACSGFPECKNAKPLVNAITDSQGVKMQCLKCQIGEIVQRRTKTGRFFYGCSRYPACDYASWKKPTNNTN